jgi:hypothetical protein
VLRSGKSGLLPWPELKNPVAFCIHPETDYGQLLRESLLKLFAIPGLDIENTFLIHS